MFLRSFVLVRKVEDKSFDADKPKKFNYACITLPHCLLIRSQPSVNYYSRLNTMKITEKIKKNYSFLFKGFAFR